MNSDNNKVTTEIVVKEEMDVEETAGITMFLCLFFLLWLYKLQHNKSPKGSYRRVGLV